MGDNNQSGLFVATTNVWDPQEIYSTEVTSPEFKELLVRLYQNLNLMSIALNLKDTGYYDTTEIATGSSFFPDPTKTGQRGQNFRGVYRYTVNFGALPNATTKTVTIPLPLNNATQVTKLYGSATNPTIPVWIPIPYSSPTLNNNIELYATQNLGNPDETDINIRTAIDYSGYTICYVIFEYLRF